MRRKPQFLVPNYKDTFPAKNDAQSLFVNFLPRVFVITGGRNPSGNASYYSDVYIDAGNKELLHQKLQIKDNLSHNFMTSASKIFLKKVFPQLFETFAM